MAKRGRPKGSKNKKSKVIKVTKPTKPTKATKITKITKTKPALITTVVSNETVETDILCCMCNKKPSVQTIPFKANEHSPEIMLSVCMPCLLSFSTPPQNDFGDKITKDGDYIWDEGEEEAYIEEVKKNKKKCLKKIRKMSNRSLDKLNKGKCKHLCGGKYVSGTGLMCKSCGQKISKSFDKE